MRDEEPLSPLSPVTVLHNISISVTKVESPVSACAGVRRRAHLRSLSDVTPRTVPAASPRTRSHSERPRPPASPALTAPAPRAVRSARCSPAVSRDRLDTPPPERAAPRYRLRATTLADPWRKMSDVDLRTGNAIDPWVRNSPANRQRTASRLEVDIDRAIADAEKRESTVKRGKLERKAATVCESCGATSCECRRRLSVDTRCTCARSPARLTARRPVRALSDEDARPRRLYKSSSQRVIYASTDGGGVGGGGGGGDVVNKPAEPLLETTC